MNLEWVAYPFLFAAIYFEAFMLLTFLSAPAKERRERGASEKTPKVAMIVPCWNEERTIGGTVESLLALEYPPEKLAIVLVNDGSTDNTKTVMDSYRGHPQITVMHKENGGKHTALNAGIEAAEDAELVGCLDADSFVEASALKEIVSCFDDERVGAATAAMSVHEPKNLLESMQNAEYIMGIALRHVLSAVNGIYVTPGPFSLYRRDLVLELGGFRRGHNTEDMEMALRIQRAGFEIDNAPRARVFTKVPRTVPKLVKQRIRWTTGFLKNVSMDYRDMVGNPRFGTLGLLVLPLGFTAIAGGVLLFLLALGLTLQTLVERFFVTSGVPLSYVFSPRVQIEWFYLPISAIVMFATVAIVGSIIFTLIGRRVSRTPAKLGLGIVSYLFIYGLIAPFWLVKALYDAVTKKHQSWR